MAKDPEKVMWNDREQAKKGGRPGFQVTQEVVDEVEHLAMRGLKLTQMAHVLGISYNTLNEKKKMFPELNEAIHRGHSKGVEAVAGKLFEKALVGESRSIEFYLSNVDSENWSKSNNNNNNVNVNIGEQKGINDFYEKDVEYKDDQDANTETE